MNISDEVKTKHLESKVKETSVTCSNAIRLRERFNLVIEAIMKTLEPKPNIQAKALKDTNTNIPHAD